MKQTLLEIVQTVLSSLDSDSVNSIGDTDESLQVTSIVKDVYYDFITRIGFPEHKELFELEASGDPSKPLLMTRPSGVTSIDWIKYDKKPDDADSILYQDVTALDLNYFLERMYDLSSGDDNVVSFTHTIEGSSISILGYNDRHPTYWSSFDDETIIFDSYYSDLDTTLQKNKSLCWGLTEPTFELSDSFTPDLDAQQFPTFIQEVKEQAFSELKQIPNSLAARKARRGNIVLQKRKRALPTEVSELDRLPNYGRR